MTRSPTARPAGLGGLCPDSAPAGTSQRPPRPPRVPPVRPSGESRLSFLNPTGSVAGAWSPSHCAPAAATASWPPCPTRPPAATPRHALPRGAQVSPACVPLRAPPYPSLRGGGRWPLLPPRPPLCHSHRWLPRGLPLLLLLLLLPPLRRAPSAPGALEPAGVLWTGAWRSRATTAAATTATDRPPPARPLPAAPLSAPPRPALPLYLGASPPLAALLPALPAPVPRCRCRSGRAAGLGFLVSSVRAGLPERACASASECVCGLA